MKQILISLLLLIMCNLSVNAAVMEGGVSKTGMGNSSMIVDNATNMPVSGAKVSIPKNNYTTYSDEQL